jgi:hypothetical protein
MNGETVDEKTTELFKKEWFYKLMNYALDAKAYGYTLVNLGDMINNEFPNLTVVRRWNISPDRHQVTAYVYSLSGLNFLDPNQADANGNKIIDWTIWIDTPSVDGYSTCGYGYLYKVAYYEIMLRNNMGYNATALELYGQPIRVLKTAKQDPVERAEQENGLAAMGASGWAIIDPTDELELLAGSTGAGKNQGFDNFENRALKMISKIILGHADAMDSQQGKLGGEDGAADAIKRTEKIDNQWMEYIVNTKVIPKLMNLGIKIPAGYKFCILNNKEKEEARLKEDTNNKVVSEIAVNMKNAGLQMDPEYFTERTGIPAEKIETEVEPEKELDDKVKIKLKNLYR